MHLFFLQLVLFLPALCRKMGVPYCIVKGKARLGALVRRKTCTCVAVTQVTSPTVVFLAQTTPWTFPIRYCKVLSEVFSFFNIVRLLIVISIEEVRHISYCFCSNLKRIMTSIFWPFSLCFEKLNSY